MSVGVTESVPAVRPPVLKFPPVHETARADVHDKSEGDPYTTVVGNAVRRADTPLDVGGVGVVGGVGHEGPLQAGGVTVGQAGPVQVEGGTKIHSTPVQTNELQLAVTLAPEEFVFVVVVLVPGLVVVVGTGVPPTAIPAK